MPENPCILIKRPKLAYIPFQFQDAWNMPNTESVAEEGGEYENAVTSIDDAEKEGKIKSKTVWATFVTVLSFPLP